MLAAAMLQGSFSVGGRLGQRLVSAAWADSGHKTVRGPKNSHRTEYG